MFENTEFWEEMINVYPQILQIISNLSRKEYLSITDLRTMTTWWSDAAKEFFELNNNLQPAAGEKTKITIHPEDKEFYKECFRDRVRGINIDESFEYRIKTRENHYDRITAKSRLVKDEKSENRFLIMLYENHGIAEEIDSITGLRTEAALASAIETCIAQKKPLIFVKIALEQFGRINVLYGAEYADAILNAVTQQIISHKTSKGFAYRMQGAKFLLTFEDMTYDELRNIYKDIKESLFSEIYIEGKKFPLRISGGAFRMDADGAEYNVIRSRLTYAHEHSKYFEHGNLVIYNEQVCKGESFDFNLIKTIHRDAVDDKSGFFLCYQPIVDSTTDEIKGMEALLRWKDEEHGVVPPGMFIEWLEEDVCIYDLGNWILKRALSDCKRISEDNPDFFVNVNVCPNQLENSDFRNSVVTLLGESGLFPHQLCIEFTERCRRLDTALLRREAECFKSYGIRVALDDFGVGTSSLALVMDMPVDEIKIDMQFVRGIENKPFNQALVKSVIDFSNRMNMDSCIEGVENSELRDYLSSYGATLYQGYLYSKPVTIEEFEKLVKARNKKA